jgi:hypothetical protein
MFLYLSAELSAAEGHYFVNRLQSKGNIDKLRVERGFRAQGSFYTSLNRIRNEF